MIHLQHKTPSSHVAEIAGGWKFIIITYASVSVTIV